MMRENPPGHCRGETENRRGWDCSYKKYRRISNTDSVDAKSDQLLIQ